MVEKSVLEFCKLSFIILLAAYSEGTTYYDISEHLLRLNVNTNSEGT